MKMHNVKISLLLLLIVFSGSFLYAQEEQSTIRERMEEASLREGTEAADLIEDMEHWGLDALNRVSPTAPDVKAPLPPADSKIEPLTYTREQKWWWNLFKEGKLSMTDTTVIWPKFLKFCVDVYNWGDRTFNSYDPEYVIGTGKRWKVRIVSDNWLDSYALKLPQGINTTMSSDVYANLGAYIQYMAVSVGSSYDIQKLFNKKEPDHKKY